MSSFAATQAAYQADVAAVLERLDKAHVRPLTRDSYRAMATCYDSRHASRS